MRAYVALLVLVGGAVMFCVRAVTDARAPRLSAFALVPLFALSEVFVVHLHTRRSAHTISLVEIPLVIGLLYVSPLPLVLAHLVGGGVALAFHRGQRAVKLVFNLASFALQDGAAILCFTVLASDARATSPSTWLAMAVACAVASLTGIVLVQGAMSLAGDQPGRPERLEAAALGLAATGITTSTGLALSILAEHHGAAALLVFLPLVAIYMANRSYVMARRERRHVETLHDAAELLVPHRSDRVVLDDLLRRACEAFAVEAVIVAFLGADAPDRSSLMVTAHTTDPALLIEAAEWDVLADYVASSPSVILQGPGRRSSPRGGSCPIPVRNGMLVRLTLDNKAIGCLAAVNRLGDVGRFSSDDLRVLETIARQITTAIAGAAPDNSSVELRVLDAELRYRERHHGLTGLANLAGLSERLQATLEEGRMQETSLLLIDVELDGGVADDPSGREQVVLVLSQRLARCVRQPDDVAQLEDRRFAVVAHTPGGHREALAIAHRLRESMKSRVNVGHGFVNVDVNVGVAGVVPHYGADAMLAAAEIALDMARHSVAGVEIVGLS